MSQYHVDPERVYLVGHSNGAFMSHRLACDLAPRIAAIVALAGDDWKDQTKCQPSEPVSILQVHGDLDLVIQYGGGTAFPGAGEYPAARDSIGGWGRIDGCKGDLIDTGLNLDLDFLISGAETKVESFTGCPKGIDVQLWTMQGDGHIPALQSTWSDYIYTFLRSHPKR
jgi:polyhydroxybutyrate depolymerase